MRLSALAKHSNSRNRLYTFAVNGEKLLAKCYGGLWAERHSRQERFALGHWREAGYPVAEIRDVLIPQLKSPYLVMTYINGISFREYLSSSDVGLDDKLSRLGGFFRDMSCRHGRAISGNDRIMVHYNTSSSNVLLAEERFCYVDFETLGKGKDVLDAASIEVANSCRWAVGDIGVACLDRVLLLMVSAYASQERVLRRAVNRTLGRGLQFCHRLQDRRRKLLRPQCITKYDIAEALKKII